MSGKDCEICNTGLCKAVDARKEGGLSERATCREMSDESEGLYSENAILNRYRYHTGKKKVCQSDTPTFNELKKEFEEVKRLEPLIEKENVTLEELNKLINKAAKVQNRLAEHRIRLERDLGKDLTWVTNTELCFCGAVNLAREDLGNWRDAFRAVSKEGRIPIKNLLEWHIKHYGVVMPAAGPWKPR